MSSNLVDFINKLKEMNWPQEFKEKLKLGNIESNVGIATLWSYQDVVAKNIDNSNYCVMGNFYDKQNGLEPLIRNCLANPNLRYIILVGNDKSGSKDTVVSFFEDGFKDGFVVDTKVRLPKTIPDSALELLRKNVKLIDLTSVIKNLNDRKNMLK